MPFESSLPLVVVAAASAAGAVADMIVRVTGNVIDKATPGTVLVGVKATLHKKGGRWLVADAEAEPARPGGKAGPAERR